MQYKEGTVSVTNGSQDVVGTNTYWRNNIKVGDFFKIVGESEYYEIASVTDDTHLSLTTPYQGATGSGKSYVILRDYTENYKLPEISKGDLDWHISYNRAMKIIDEKLKELGA